MTQERIDTPREFALVKRARSFAHAGRGIWLMVKTTPNAWVHIIVLIAAVVLGWYVSLSLIEWTLLALVSGLVLAAEAFNTAIEIDIDLTSPEYHPYARDTKDVAAGAVLLSAITAAVVGALIFVPHILSLL